MEMSFIVLIVLYNHFIFIPTVNKLMMKIMKMMMMMMMMMIDDDDDNDDDKGGYGHSSPDKNFNLGVKLAIFVPANHISTSPVEKVSHSIGKILGLPFIDNIHK